MCLVNTTTRLRRDDTLEPSPDPKGPATTAAGAFSGNEGVAAAAAAAAVVAAGPLRRAMTRDCRRCGGVDSNEVDCERMEGGEVDCNGRAGNGVDCEEVEREGEDFERVDGEGVWLR